MSYGRVFHKGCSGEFVGGPDFACNSCGQKWDGLNWQIAEYRSAVMPKEAKEGGA